MPNAKLTKDDGLVLVLPASSIVAIVSISKAEEKPAKNPDATSLIFSTFRGFSIFFLGMTARAAFDAVAERDDEPRDWLELPVGEDATYLSPDGISLVEGVQLPDGEGGLRVWFNRPDGQTAYTDVDHDDALLDRLAALVGGDDSGDASPSPAPQPTLRAPARRAKR